MIKTVIIEYSNYDYDICYENCMNDVNDTIKTYNIHKEDILEYRTELSEESRPYSTNISKVLYKMKVTMSWWE